MIDIIDVIAMIGNHSEGKNHIWGSRAHKRWQQSNTISRHVEFGIAILEDTGMEPMVGGLASRT